MTNEQAKRQGQINARVLLNSEHPELLDIWKAITSLVDRFESEIDDLTEELALDQIPGPTSNESPEIAEHRNWELESTKRHLLEIILREQILGEEIDDELEYNPIHRMVYDLRDPN